MLSKNKVLVIFLWMFCIGFFLKSNWQPLFVWEGRTDLEIVTHAAKNLLDGKPVYNYDDLWQHTKPPLATLVFIPLANIPPSILWPVWDILNILSLFFLSWVFASWLVKDKRKPQFHFLLTLGIVSVTNFYLYELRYGQYNMLSLGLIVLSARSKSLTLAALSLTLAGFLKPTNVLFLPWILANHTRPRFLISYALGTTLLLSLVYFFFFGSEQFINDHKIWIRFLGESTEKYLYREVNYGIPAAISSFTNSRLLHNFLLLFGLFLGFWGKNKTYSLMHLSFCAFLSLAVSPMTWWANFCLLLPVSIIIFNKVFRDLKEKRILSWKSTAGLITLYSGTQLIFPNYLPDIIMKNIPRLANPVWVYLAFYFSYFYLKLKESKKCPAGG